MSISVSKSTSIYIYICLSIYHSIYLIPSPYYEIQKPQSLDGCMAGRVGEWPAGRVDGCVASWPASWPAGWPGGRPGGRLAGWPGGRVAGWPWLWPIPNQGDWLFVHSVEVTTLQA